MSELDAEPLPPAKVEEAWESVAADPDLLAAPGPGVPGNIPHAEDLNLNIGWDRFEKLTLALTRRVRGLRGIKFRRYGTQGQAQHGIDLAGREPDGTYTVIQCKDYQVFSADDVRAAVEKFATGRRPFGANRFIVVTSALTQATQFANELAALEDSYPDLELDLWGSEQINDFLRLQGDVVARFWTRETAETFCTGAPLPGVPVPLPDRQEQADRILVGPLQTEDLAPVLRRADSMRSETPEESARLYGELADRLSDGGFRGHAFTMRSRQLDALEEARLAERAVDLAASLAITAAYFGDRDQPRVLLRRIGKVIADAAASETPLPANAQRHAQLLEAAARSISDPRGDFSRLRTALEERIDPLAEPSYQPVLVLLLAEHMLASAPDQLEGLDPLLAPAIALPVERLGGRLGEDVAVRLRLVRAEYNEAERTELKRLAQRHRVPGRHAALISAREARRCVMEGRAEEAVEGWRDAVYDGIHAGVDQDAADWLYAIRGTNVQYGLWSSDIDDEHRLAQALRVTGSGRLLERVRSPREHALSLQVQGKPFEAALSARRWLTDTVVTGDWASEVEALAFLGDLYRDNHEPALAADYYQRAGRAKKLKELAAAVGDVSLPLTTAINAPWWVLHARATLIEAQADLVDDGNAGRLLTELIALAERGKAGELDDSPLYLLTDQATRTACALAARGTPAQALALLDLLAPDVPRSPDQYRRSDDHHAGACVAIARAHPSIAMAALTRLFDLADGRAERALRLVISDEVVGMLVEPRQEAGSAVDIRAQGALTDTDRANLQARVVRLDDTGFEQAHIALARIAPEHPAVRTHAEQARDRILHYPDPEVGRAVLGTNLVPDSYLVSCLDTAARSECLRKLLSIASDARQVAMNRQDALTGVRNLVGDLSIALQDEVFKSAQRYVQGEANGSHLDDQVTGEPHPFSTFRFNMGSASLRGAGLLLAAASATNSDAHGWVRDQAFALLSSSDIEEVEVAARAIMWLPPDVAAGIDAALLASHSEISVRQASAMLCLRNLDRYSETAMRLARDREFRVRLVLAKEAAHAITEESGPLTAILEELSLDPRHSVRSAVSWR